MTGNATPLSRNALAESHDFGQRQANLGHSPLFAVAFSDTLPTPSAPTCNEAPLPALSSIMSTDIRNEASELDAVTDNLGRTSIVNNQEDGLGPDGQPLPKTDDEYAQHQLTLRAIVSSKEAGVIIGKGGKNVADLRDETGVKAGVSKVVQGIHDRVLTVTGGLDQICRAYSIVAKGLLEGAPAMGMGGVINPNGTHRKYMCWLLH